MTKPAVHTLDLAFLGNPQAIASYLIPHRSGVVLVECGPGSTYPTLVAALAAYGYSPEEVTDLLLSHIHLDHAGAAGLLAKHGTRIHVHTVGAPHMADPRRLLSSARRIYRDQMDSLWGAFLPVPEVQLNPLADGDVIAVEELSFQVLDTPGHANHHCAFLLEALCFAGDVGGVRLPGAGLVEVPLPPPETHLEKWAASLDRLIALPLEAIATTHFGIHPDVSWHLATLRSEIDRIQRWLYGAIRDEPDQEAFRARYYAWVKGAEKTSGLAQDKIAIFASVNPRAMSADGLYRYWKRHLVNGEAPQ